MSQDQRHEAVHRGGPTNSATGSIATHAPVGGIPMAARSRSTATMILIVGRLLVAGAAYAGPPAVPDYEVKFFLDPARILDNLNEPTGVVHDALALSSSVTKLRMLFLDGKNHDLNEVGWNVR